MSRREQEIWQACDDLLALGKIPREITGEAIGNRLRELKLKPGSLTYRYRYRDSWMEERGLTRENLEEPSKPSDIIDRSAAIFRKTIEESIRAEYETKYQEAKKETEDANQRYQGSQQALEEITKTKQILEKELSATQEEGLNLKQQFTQERKKRLQLEERVNASEKRCEQQQLDFEQQLKQIKDLHEEALNVLQKVATTAQNEYKHEIEAVRTLRESERHQWIVEKDTLKVQTSKLERQLDYSLLLEQKAQEKIKEMMQLTERLEAEVGSTQHKYEHLEAKNHLDLQALTTLQAENATLRSTLEKQDNQHKELVASLQTEQARLGRLEENFKSVLAEIIQLKNQDKTNIKA